MAAFSSKSSPSLDLSGIFPPIVTPFEDNEEISHGKLTENFSKWNDIPFRGGRVFISMIAEKESRFNYLSINCSVSRSLTTMEPRPLLLVKYSK